jgi:hypothetical protein
MIAGPSKELGACQRHSYGIALGTSVASTKVRPVSIPKIYCEGGLPPGAAEVVTLRDSNWMVLLEDGIAVDLRICKG